jgi:hypothetical protein
VKAKTTTGILFASWLLGALLLFCITESSAAAAKPEWQEKSDNNSLRTDIPKNMLSDPTSIPKEKGKYINSSLPQYQDIDAALKIVDDALAKAGKK